MPHHLLNILLIQQLQLGVMKIENLKFGLLEPGELTDQRVSCQLLLYDVLLL